MRPNLDEKIRALNAEFAQAIETGRSDDVAGLIEAHPDLVSGRGWYPPPLHCCVLWDQVGIAGLLLDHGADLEQLDPDQQTTPLRYAIVHARTSLVQFFLDRGAFTGLAGTDKCSAFELAQRARDGAFEEFEDLPGREAYQAVVEAMEAWQTRGERDG